MANNHPSKQAQTTYEQAVDITAIYLGPAAQRFVDRQIKNHLNKTPSHLTKSDLKKLIDWVKISVSFLTEDSKLIEEYTRKLERLAESKD